MPSKSEREGERDIPGPEEEEHFHENEGYQLISTFNQEDEPDKIEPSDPILPNPITLKESDIPPEDKMSQGHSCSLTTTRAY
jgi:hypothetical protein